MLLNKINAQAFTIDGSVTINSAIADWPIGYRQLACKCFDVTLVTCDGAGADFTDEYLRMSADEQYGGLVSSSGVSEP